MAPLGPAPRMTKEWLRAHCRANKLYQTPSLNDTLHLHYQGFSRIENLEEYTGLKAVFLEGNGLESLDGLQSAPGLRCIFAQQNCLPRIEHLESLKQLDTLNVSSNRLESLDGLEALQCLTSLQAAHNQLRSVSALAPLATVPGLSSVDVTDNELDGEAEELVALLARMPCLRALYLSAGNPIAAKLRPYRKRLVAALPQLAYLDDRPVFDAERRAAEAWARGGEAEERVERERIIAEKAAATRANFQHITQLREAAKARRRAAAAERGETLSDEERADRPISGGGYDDTEQAVEVEPPELVRARETLARYPPLAGEEEPVFLTHTREALRKAGRLGPQPGEEQLRPWPRGEAGDEAAEGESDEIARLEALGRAAWARDQTASYEDDDAPAAPPPQQQQQQFMPARGVLIEELGGEEAPGGGDDEDGQYTAQRIPPMMATPRQSSASGGAGMDDID